MFSCEFCEIFKDNFFTEHFRVTASETKQFILLSITTEKKKLDLLKNGNATFNKNLRVDESWEKRSKCLIQGTYQILSEEINMQSE